MSIFEAIGGALGFSPLEKFNKEYNLTNSSYSSIIGNNTAFIIGGGRNTNIYGTDVKLVIDWETFFVNSSTGGKSFPGMMASGFIFGIGGDTGFLIGNKSDFKYWGEDFSVARQRHEFKCTFPQLNKQEIQIPLSVKIAIGLGTIGLLLGSLIARFEFGLYSTTSATQHPVSTSIVAFVIPAFETRWLFTMKLIEYSLSFMSATESALINAKDALCNAERALVTARTALATLVAASTDHDTPAEIAALAAAGTEVANFAENVRKSTTTVQNATIARASALTALLATSPEAKKTYATGLKAAAEAKVVAAKAAADALALIPITTQINADQYGITCNTFTINDNKSFIRLVSADSKSEVASPAADVSGSIILDSSTITLNSNGNSSIKLTGGDLRPNPSVSITTCGNDSSAIQLVASSKLGLIGANIIANTDGVIISHGTVGDQGLASITNKNISLSVGLPGGPLGPSIEITPISIIFKVGLTTLTMSNMGIVIDAPAMEVKCEPTNVTISPLGVSEKLGVNTRELTSIGHKIGAADSVVEILPTGIKNQAPLLAISAEASLEIKGILSEIISNAILTIDAGINQND